MIRWGSYLAIVFVGYLATGLYVIRGDEQALIRRFGKAHPNVAAPGIAWDLPWPFVKIDRVKINELRSITIGQGQGEEELGNDFLRPFTNSRVSEFLTGDKNVIHLQILIQYRVGEIHDFLLNHEDPERQLKLEVESLANELFSRSGVDYVHPLGLQELRSELFRQSRLMAENRKFGVILEDVTIQDVRPPGVVRKAFLEVSNARNESERVISTAQTGAERVVTQAKAQSSQILNEARGAKQEIVSLAKGQADRFGAILNQIDVDVRTGSGARSELRQQAMLRLYVEMMGEVLPRVRRFVMVGSHRPVEFTISPDSKPSE